MARLTPSSIPARKRKNATIRGFPPTSTDLLTYSLIINQLFRDEVAAC